MLRMLWAALQNMAELPVLVLLQLSREELAANQCTAAVAGAEGVQSTQATLKGPAAKAGELTPMMTPQLQLAAVGALPEAQAEGQEPAARATIA